jgi:hypothetical protein
MEEEPRGIRCDTPLRHSKKEMSGVQCGCSLHPPGKVGQLGIVGQATPSRRTMTVDGTAAYHVGIAVW